MDYTPKLHYRKSIRLKNYNYSQAGFYFITICTQNHEYLLGEINEDEMILNDAGEMIKKWYFELENKFKSIKCHEMTIMPNHFHCIIEIIQPACTCNVGADLCVCPKHKGGHIGPPLQRVIQWFKTMTMNEYIRGVKEQRWKRFNKRFWQRNYYEHIIRHEASYVQISQYIQDNPIKWQEDKYYV